MTNRLCICEQWQIRERNGHSATCNRANRKQIVENLKPIKAKKPIAKTSDKMAEALKEYAKKRKLFLEANPICEVLKDRPATDIHHKRGRNTIELLLDDNLWLAVSREAHRKIELNPVWAKEMGYSLIRTQTEPHKI